MVSLQALAASPLLFNHPRLHHLGNLLFDIRLLPLNLGEEFSSDLKLIMVAGSELMNVEIRRPAYVCVILRACSELLSGRNTKYYTAYCTVFTETFDRSSTVSKLTPKFMCSLHLTVNCFQLPGVCSRSPWYCLLFFRHYNVLNDRDCQLCLSYDLCASGLWLKKKKTECRLHF